MFALDPSISTIEPLSHLYATSLTPMFELPTILSVSPSAHLIVSKCSIVLPLYSKLAVTLTSSSLGQFTQTRTAFELPTKLLPKSFETASNTNCVAFPSVKSAGIVNVADFFPVESFSNTGPPLLDQ